MKMVVMTTVLLFLLCVVVEVHSQSQTYPFVRFENDGPALSNHSYLDLSTVGYNLDGSNSVQCVTDLTTCCRGQFGDHRGDWFLPNGTILPGVTSSSELGIYIRQRREDMRVDLYRRNNGIANGIYECTIETSEDNDESGGRAIVYVGLYTSGGEVTIPDGMTYTLESSLDAESPQFSLTCISTGGPATNVTWTRDSQTVSGGNMTVLDDREAAQYTHTLTVSGREEGLYQCTVSNDMPSSDSAQLNVQVSGQPSVSMGSRTATSISLSWSVPSDSLVDRYEVRWERDTSGECNKGDEGSDTLTADTTSYDIMDLEEGSSYTIAVIASNAIGSTVSDSVSGVTNEIVPSTPPTSVTTFDVTPFNITVQWGPVNCIQRNGDITSYSVRYGVQGDGSTQTESVSGGDTTETILSGLHSFTTYTIEVAAVNSAGTGVYSSPISEKTEESDAFFQLQLKEVVTCYAFVSDQSIQRLEDVTKAVQETLSDLCMCSITTDNIVEEFFICSSPSSLYVTYRARLSGIPDGHILVSYLEGWVSGGASVLVQGAQIKVDSECPVSIISFDDGECSQSPIGVRPFSPGPTDNATATDNTAATASDNTAAVIGGVVVAIVFIIAVLVFGMTVLVLVWKSRHGNPSKQKTEEQPMSSLSGFTGEPHTGLSTGTNVAYGVLKDREHSSGYVSVGRGQPPVESSPQPQSGGGEYEVPGLPEQSPAATAVSPPDRKGGSQEEAVYEPI